MPAPATVHTPPANQPNTAPTGPESSSLGGTSQQSLPESQSMKMRAEKVGLLQVGDIEITPEIESYFRDNATIIAYQIKSFNEQNKPLTSDQKKFLQLYFEDGKGDILLQEESGQMLTHLMIEKEMFLRLAALQKKIEIVKRGNPTSAIDYDLPLTELQSWLSRMKPEEKRKIAYVMGGIISGATGVVGLTASVVAGLLLNQPSIPLAVAGAEVALASAAGAGVGGAALANKLNEWRRDGRIRITTLAIDTSQIPLDTQDYMTYLADNIDERSTVEFLKKAAEGQVRFYNALGADTKDLNVLTPWERMDLGGVSGITPSIDMASQNLQTRWMRDRLDILRKNGGPLSVNPGLRAARFLEAQTSLITNYAKERLLQIEIGKDGIQATITELSQKRDQIQNPPDLDKRKKDKQVELSVVEKELTDLQTELTDLTKRIDNLNLESAKLTASQPSLQADVDKYNDSTIDPATSWPKGELKILQREINNLVSDNNTAEANYNAQQVAIPASDSNAAEKKVAIETLKNQTIQGYNNQIEQKRARERQIKDRIEQINQQLAKLPEITAELTVSNPKKTNIEKEIKKRKTRIAKLKKQIELGLDDAELQKVHQLEAAIQALSRYDEVNSTLAQSYIEENEAGVNDLTDRNQQTEYGQNYSQGYLRTIRLIFDYNHPPKGVKVEDFFKGATVLLPLDELAQLFAARFDIAIPVPLPAGYPTNLDFVYTALKTDQPALADFNSFFIPLLKRLEEKAQRIS